MSKKKKNKKPRFTAKREGVAFRRHEFQKLRRRAEESVRTLERRSPDVAEEFKKNPEKLIEAFGELLTATDWRTVRLDPRVIANYVGREPLPEQGGDKELAAYVDECLDKIIDEGARAWLTTIGLGVQTDLVERERDRLAWANLFLLNMLGNREAQPHTIPLLHNLFWASYNDYLFQRNIQAFIGRVLNPDLLTEPAYAEALAADWEEGGLNLEALAERLGEPADELAARLAETGRLVVLTEDDLAPHFADGKMVTNVQDELLRQAHDILRAAQDNRARPEEIDAAAAGLVRETAARHAEVFRGAAELEALEGTLRELAGSERGELITSLAARAAAAMTQLPPRLNPLFDALFFAGVRRAAAAEYEEAVAQAKAETVTADDEPRRIITPEEARREEDAGN
ncbi:MAG: hypothetical protein GF399_06610 [Candidatus Coatesbacteria bacterium]|nr:hypothetical protein [Candidatus Coatesbacteria bacterium]